MAKKKTTTRRQPTADPTALGRNFKRRIKSGPIMLGPTAKEYLRPSLVKIYKHAGADFILLENEHVIFNGPSLADFVQSARDNQLPVIAKVGQLERAEIARLLDHGIVGIQLPNTESREQLLELYDLVKYRPLGTRAVAPCYGNVDYVRPADGPAWIKKANKATSIIAHIETEGGYANLEEIATTPGVDMLYVGLADFSVAMGHPLQTNHPVVKKAVMKIHAACTKNNLPFGITPSDPKVAAYWAKRGARFFEMIDEMAYLDDVLSAAIGEWRGAID